MCVCSFLQEEMLGPASFSLRDTGMRRNSGFSSDISQQNWSEDGRELLLSSWQALSWGQSCQSRFQGAVPTLAADGCHCHPSHRAATSPSPHEQGIIHLLSFPGCPTWQEFTAAQLLSSFYFFSFFFFFLCIGFEIIIVLGGSRKGFADSLLVFMT